MPADGFRWLLALVVAAHGIGQVLIMHVLSANMGLVVSGRSLLLTPLLGDGIVRLVASAVAAAVLIGFVVATGGYLARAAWWRTLVVASAIASAALIVAMWDGLPRSSAVFALGFDVLAVAALVIAHWPADQPLEA